MRITPPLPIGDIDQILEQTEPLWEELRGNRIFISGGTGFFGCWLVESFLAANRAFDLKAELIVLTRSAAAFRAKCPHLVEATGLKLVTGDVRDFAFPEGEFGFVIHAATDTVAGDPLNTFSTIVDGTRHCLDFAERSGAVKFLLTSSGAVYGKQPSELGHIPEEYIGGPDSLSPAAAYGEGKRAAETLCAIYGERTPIQCKIARCFAFVGPHLPLDAHFAIGNFIRDAMAGGPIVIHGDGTPVRSYLYAADLAVWLWTILFEAPALRAFNVGSDYPLSIRELASEVVRVIDPSAEVRVARAPSSEIPPLQYVPCVRRARTELGLDVTVGLGQAIRRTALWHGSQTSV
jgi:nucleoside-diphosphate-sugar epimerase